MSVNRLSHQKQHGMFVRYQNRRLPWMHMHEVRLGDPRLYRWVMGYKQWLKHGLHVPQHGSFRQSKGL